MIYIVTALYHEAKPLIETFQLKQVKSIQAFRVFQDTERTMTLVVCCTGKAAAAAGVGHVCALYGVSDADFLIHAGTAACLTAGAAAPGSLFLCHKITDAASRRTYYPDMLLAAGLEEAEIVTVDRVIEITDDAMRPAAAGIILADMEASAVWEAGMLFFAPHRILTVKAVSDMGDGGSVTADRMTRVMTENVPALKRLVCAANQLQTALKKDSGISDDTQVILEELSADMHCSETMHIRLRQLIRYAELENTDISRLKARLYQTGVLPCRDRKEGKKALEQIRNSLL